MDFGGGSEDSCCARLSGRATGSDVHLRCRRLRHRLTLLQEFQQRWPAPRIPVDQHGNVAGFGHLHERVGLRMAAGQFCLSRSHFRLYSLCHFVLGSPRTLRRGCPIFCDFRFHESDAVCASGWSIWTQRHSGHQPRVSGQFGRGEQLLGRCSFLHRYSVARRGGSRETVASSKAACLSRCSLQPL